MTSVVTGASGHLGGNLVRQLRASNEKVRAIVHRDTRAIEGLKVTRAEASLTDQASLEKAFKGAHTVYHLAAKISIRGDPDGSVRRTNVDGARNAAKAALAVGVKKFVHVSSVHAFNLAHGRGAIDETHPKSGAKNYAYDKSKADGESEVRRVIAQGLDATIVNPTGIIGPYDFKPSRIGQVLLDLRAKKMPALVTGGFDFVDVRDVASSIIAAGQRGRTGENYLLGGHRFTVAELAKIAASISGVPAPNFTSPRTLALLGVPFAALAAKRSGTEPAFTRESIGALAHGRIVNHQKAAAELSHAPRALEQTIADTYAWFDE